MKDLESPDTRLGIHANEDAVGSARKRGREAKQLFWMRLRREGRIRG